MKTKTTAKPKQRQAIIWGRYSSDQQKDGDSRDRQDRLNHALAKREDIRVIAEHFDPATSVKDGATPLFKKVVSTLPDGVGIICENLDRINRGHPWRAKAYIADLLEAGHWIITSQDGREYNNASIEDIDTMVIGDMATNVARYENNKRTKRVREEKTAAIELARKGKPAPLGAWLPAHLKYNPLTNAYDIREDRREVLEGIFKDYAKGKGVTAITARLNTEQVPTFRGKAIGKWMKSTIFTLLRYEGVIGVLNYKGERIKDAFPPAIKEKLFYQVQSILESNKTRHGNYASNRVNNVFRGVCQCAKCGNTMRVTVDGYLACNGYQTHQCKVKNMMRFPQMEAELAQWFIIKASDALLGKEDTVSPVTALEAQQNALNQRIDVTLGLLDDDTHSLPLDKIKSRLAKLEQERKGIEQAIAVAKSQTVTNAVLPDTIKQLQKLIAGSLSDQETRRKINDIVPSIIEKITIDLSDKRTANFVVTLKNGEQATWIYVSSKFRKFRTLEGKASPKDGFYEVI